MLILISVSLSFEWVNFGKFISKPHFSHLYNGENKTNHIDLLPGLN